MKYGIALVGCALALIGCSSGNRASSAPPAPQASIAVPPATPALPPAPQEVLLAWVAEAGEGGTPTTYYLSLAGEVRGSHPGIVVGAGNTVLEISETLQEQLGCDDMDSSSPNVDSRLSAKTLEGSDRALWEEHVTPDPELSVSHSLQVLGSVGSQLFVRHSVYEYGCGAAHGMSGSSFRVIEAATATQLDPQLEALEAVHLDAAKIALINGLRADDLGDEIPSVLEATADQLDVIGLEPAWTAGRFDLAAVFAMETAHAFANSDWGSEQRVATVAAPTATARYQAPWADRAQPALRSFAEDASHAATGVRGVALVNDTPALRAAFGVR